MRRVPESELETDFERQFAWGDDERHLYNPNRRKAAVMAAELRLETVISLVNRFATTGKTVGDFASAQGNFGLLLAEQGYQVTAVDIKPEFLNYSLKKHTHGKFETVLANIIEYRHHQPFDVVLLGEIIEHVAFPLDLLKSAYENLKPGGILVLTTPNGNEFGNQLPTYSQVTNIEELIPKQFHWGDHLFLYTDSELSSLFAQAGFEILEQQKIGSSYASQIKGLRYLMPIRLLQWLERTTRKWRKADKDCTCTHVVVGQRIAPRVSPQ